MVTNCPSCAKPITMNVPPVRGPSGAGNEGWICLYCNTQVCIHCYVNHTGGKHPEVYKPDFFDDKKPEKKNKKR